MAPVKELGTQTLVTIRELDTVVGDNVGYYCFKRGPSTVMVIAITDEYTYIHPPMDENHSPHSYFPELGLVKHFIHPEKGRRRVKKIPALRCYDLGPGELPVQAVYRAYPGFYK